MACLSLFDLDSSLCYDLPALFSLTTPVFTKLTTRKKPIRRSLQNVPGMNAATAADNMDDDIHWIPSSRVNVNWYV